MFNALPRLISPLLGFLILVAYYRFGIWLAPLLPVTLPAPLIGIVALVCSFTVLGKIPRSVECSAKPLLAHMPLFFLPAILGVWHYRHLVAVEWLALLLAVVVTTPLAMMITASLAQRMQRRD